MKKLLMDMNLIDSEQMFDKILKDDKVKNQIYGYIESVGGINRARQSIRQPAPQQVWHCKISKNFKIAITKIHSDTFVTDSILIVEF